MHILLTDVLTCPRCGPEFGLILLAERTEGRRVLEGWLGCANCRERFRVDEGFADLQFGAPSAARQSAPTDQATDGARIAALLGVTEGPALVLVVGPGAVYAGALADLIPGLEVAAVWAPLASQPEREGVSRLAAADILPIRSASMRGVALTGASSDALIAEAARVVAARSRVVIASGEPEVSARLAQRGLRILAQDESIIVAERMSL